MVGKKGVVLQPVAPSRGPRRPPARTLSEARFRAAAVRYASVAAGFRGRKCHGRGLKGRGRGRWERLRRPSSPDSGPWPATSGCRLTVAVALLTRVLPVILAEGVGDALVRGGGLPVDAVGVDLEQDCDAVPGAAGDLGGGHVTEVAYGSTVRVALDAAAVAETEGRSLEVIDARVVATGPRRADRVRGQDGPGGRRPRSPDLRQLRRRHRRGGD